MFDLDLCSCHSEWGLLQSPSVPLWDLNPVFTGQDVLWHVTDTHQIFIVLMRTVRIRRNGLPLTDHYELHATYWEIMRRKYLKEILHGAGGVLLLPLL